jgi:hypothetical protein
MNIINNDGARKTREQTSGNELRIMKVKDLMISPPCNQPHFGRRQESARSSIYRPANVNNLHALDIVVSQVIRNIECNDMAGFSKGAAHPPENARVITPMNRGEMSDLHASYSPVQPGGCWQAMIRTGFMARLADEVAAEQQGSRRTNLFMPAPLNSRPHNGRL